MVIGDNHIYHYETVDECWFDAVENAKRTLGLSDGCDPRVTSQAQALLASPDWWDTSV